MPCYRQARHRARSGGQALTEFALILPVFLLTTMGVMDAARVFGAQISITNAVREAALFAMSPSGYAAWCRDPANPAQAAVDMPTTVACPAGTTIANYAADPSNIAYRVAAESSGLDLNRIVLAAPACSNAAGTPVACDVAGSPAYVTITASYSIDMLTPVMTSIWGSPKTVRASSTAYILK